MDVWFVLEKELINYRNISSSIRGILIQYEKKIRILIDRIKELSFEESQFFFDQLHDIQEKLSSVSYKYEFPLNDKLSSFTYYFDRNDIYSRKYWYIRIHNGMEWPEKEVT